MPFSEGIIDHLRDAKFLDGDGGEDGISRRNRDLVIGLEGQPQCLR